MKHLGSHWASLRNIWGGFKKPVDKNLSFGKFLKKLSEFYYLYRAFQ
jgi:hypothetical protein